MKEAFLLILAVLLYGIGTFFKRVGLMHIHPYQFSLVMGICFFAFTPLWGWLLYRQPDAFVYSKEGLTFTILHALFSLAAGVVVAFLLRTTTSPSTIIVMVNLSSVITLLMSFIFLNEQINTQKIIAIILAIISLILMNG